jgi:phosphodiesterase/alkaline phosphatase D-like protein
VTGPPLLTIATPPYLQNVRPDGIVIMCETVESAPLAVEYGADPGYGESVAAESVASGGGTWFHRAVLTGLNAGQHYHYRYTTAGGDPLTPDAEFRTAPAREEDFSFSFWSDSQGHNQGAWTVDPLEPTVSMMKHMVAAGVSFGFTTGDMAEDGNSYADTRSFYLDRVARHLGTSVP